MVGFNSVQNSGKWLDFSVKTIKKHFYAQLEDFQPCYPGLCIVDYRLDVCIFKLFISSNSIVLII